MSINRRNFLKSAATAAVTIPAAKTVQASVTNSEILSGDALNPSGIQTAGVRMVPVVGGKYKVWTKRMGHGPVKVLLLHGGPGASHEYLEAIADSASITSSCTDIPGAWFLPSSTRSNTSSTCAASSFPT